MASMHLPEEEPKTEIARMLAIQAHKGCYRERKRTDIGRMFRVESFSKSEPDSLSVSCKRNWGEILERCLLPGLRV